MQVLRSKKMQLGITLVLCAMIIATGSIAWFSATQKALNEFTFNPEGVNLHDDFNDPNKDVYVENSGTEPLLVRIKFREYTEIGRSIQIPEDPDIDKLSPDLWPDHAAITDDPAVCELEDSDGNHIHDYWEWIMGGEPKWYVPADKTQIAFGAEEWSPDNREIEAVRGDIEVDGLPSILKDDETDPDPDKYDTYEEFCLAIQDDDTLYDSATGLMFQLDDAKRALTTAFLRQLQEDVDDARTALNIVQAKINKYTLEKYGVQLTRPARVLTMTEWTQGGWIADKEDESDPDVAMPAMMPGDYWVVDTDGWCYWANPLESGEATGLLLDAVNGGEKLRDERTRYYYGIDVIMQAATVDDVTEFWRMDPEPHPEIEKYGAASTDAQALLNQAARAIQIDASGGSQHSGKRNAAVVAETQKGKYWYLSGDVWKFYDGQWRYDSSSWTLDGEEYSFDVDGWFMADGEWHYMDDNWIFDGMEWTSLRSGSASKDFDTQKQGDTADVEAEQTQETGSEASGDSGADPDAESAEAENAEDGSDTESPTEPETGGESDGAAESPADSGEADDGEPDSGADTEADSA